VNEPQIRYARTSDGVNIAWYAVGEGVPYFWPSTPLGSIGDHWQMPEFRELAESIARRATLVTCDARGFGLSDRGTIDYSCEAIIRDYEAVTVAAGIDRFVFQAWSYLAIPALAFAARHPERVLAMILMNGIMRGADVAAGWKSLVRLAGEDWEHAARLISQSNEAGYARTLTLEQGRKSIQQAASQKAFISFFKAVENWDASDLLDDVTVPVLVDHYGEISMQPMEDCRRLAASLPNGTFASVMRAPGETVFDAASAVTRNFLRGVLPADARGRRHERRTPELPSGTAIILFADIADSTALTERLGDAAFRAKARDLDAALRTVIRDRAGTPIEGKLLGDGVLAVFTSARQAIEAALACGAAGSEAGLALHLGLHAGDVIREDNNVYGGAVNIASRISGLSAPGEVLVSETVRSLARTSGGVSFEDQGRRRLKGVGEAVRVWVVVEPGPVDRARPLSEPKE
jgi:class 3 adenylate cyclase